ncbi:hypothetical protein [Candidatus Regiella endosymbiont of Tuberolachnus salignus]|uniref:hypothetical protein n=1 Tax=Candidatus Regiella endosymbiont of Tuberolachnus salignus TaxID=3077956 RepID=UPI0030CCCD9A
MLISLMALSPQRKLHSGLSGQIKLAIYGLLSLALTQCGRHCAPAPRNGSLHAALSATNPSLKTRHRPATAADGGENPLPAHQRDPPSRGGDGGFGHGGKHGDGAAGAHRSKTL